MTCDFTASPEEAFARLIDGNERFLQDRLRHGELCDAKRRQELAAAQRPFASVLACADSRVSPSLVFDAGLGELFVCRNAGNLLDELVVGSLEYAVEYTACPLLAIVGHTSCGAANAAVKWARSPDFSESHNIDDVLRRLAPAVYSTRDREADDAAWADAVVRKNVELVCRQLVQSSGLIRRAIDEGRADVVGLVYDIATGGVEVVVPLNEARGW